MIINGHRVFFEYSNNCYSLTIETCDKKVIELSELSLYELISGLNYSGLSIDSIKAITSYLIHTITDRDN